MIAPYVSPWCRLPPVELARCIMENQRSQFFEDVLLLPSLLLPWNAGRHALKASNSKHRRVGSFVEIGAFDGVNKSNTYALERCCDWRGTLIEANPTNFLALQNSGRKSRMVHSGVWYAPGRCNFTSEGGIFAKTVLGDPSAGRIPESRVELRRKPVSVPCERFENLLEDERMDFLSLDVEGFEEVALGTVDPSRFKLILVEIQNLKKPTVERIRQRMVRHGMEEVWADALHGIRIPGSLVFVHANFTVVPVPGVRYWPHRKMPEENDLVEGLKVTMRHIGCPCPCPSSTGVLPARCRHTPEAVAAEQAQQARAARLPETAAWQ